MGDRVLVTGVAGFIGHYVAQHFAEQGEFVIGIDQVRPEKAAISDLSVYHVIHLPDEAFDRLLRDHVPQVCIHCAGPASVGLSMTEPSSDFYGSTVLTFEILEALRRHQPRCRLVFLSSAAVYGNPRSLPVTESHPPAPISPYGFHKWQCEQLCQEYARVYGLATASVRIFSAYGPGLRRQVLWDICRKALQEQSFTLQGTGGESRDFVHALDIAQAVALISTSAPMKGEVYNLGSGLEVRIADLADMILRVLESDRPPRFVGVVPTGVPLNWQADISRLRMLGFVPKVPLEQGVREFVNWCRAELAER